MYTSKRVVPLFSLLLILVVILSACGQAATPAPAAPAATEPPAAAPAAASGDKGVIKIYTSWPMQGAMIPEGTAMKRAVDMAVEDAGGTAVGYKLEIVNLDDASPATGSWDGTIEAENAQKCINDPDCMVYLGTYNSGAAKVSIPILNQADIAMITPANTSPCLTKKNPACQENEPAIYRPSGKINYFRTNPADDLQGQAAAKWASCLGFKKAFVLDDRQLYGKGLADIFESAAKTNGIEIVGHEGVESTNIDFRSLLTKVKASGAELVYGGFVIDSGGPQVIQQMAALGMFPATKFMGPDGLYSPGLMEAIGGAIDQANENVYITFTGLPPDQLPSEAGKAFYQNYKAKYGEDPIGFATYAYQVGRLVADAINRAGEKDRAKILDAVRNTKDFDKGIADPFSFDENGDPTIFSMSGFIVRNGNFDFREVIKPDMTCK
ncbi:MAG: branched-chain amino acid ABC transporter substrate-binding protein [Ardenticatenaceae bacterium]|nr:branched-chain amino acid ABC transporter substrate-binding protein [Ardenticatenaceae bacterium]